MRGCDITTFSLLGGRASVVDLHLKSLKEYMPGAAKDEMQKDTRIDPGKYIHNYWETQISVREGIVRVAREMGVK